MFGRFYYISEKLRVKKKADIFYKTVLFRFRLVQLVMKLFLFLD